VLDRRNEPPDDLAERGCVVALRLRKWAALGTVGCGCPVAKNVAGTPKAMASCATTEAEGRLWPSSYWLTAAGVSPTFLASSFLRSPRSCRAVVRASGSKEREASSAPLDPRSGVGMGFSVCVLAHAARLVSAPAKRQLVLFEVGVVGCLRRLPCSGPTLVGIRCRRQLAVSIRKSR
jgi:hypothetical protein